MKVRIKICGITRAEDLEVLLRLQVDALGLVFHQPSSRCLAFKEAHALSRLAEGRILRVGVFLDAAAEVVRGAVAQVGLDVLQFHGGEDRAFCAGFGLPYMKAVPMAGPVDAAAWRRRFPDACALLLDAGAGGGQTFDWRHWPAAPVGNCVLAGGLGPHNVAAAVRRLKPWGLDVSSGVEGVRKGVKDAAKITEFVMEARRAAAGE